MITEKPLDFTRSRKIGPTRGFVEDATVEAQGFAVADQLTRSRYLIPRRALGWCDHLVNLLASRPAASRRIGWCDHLVNLLASRPAASRRLEDAFFEW